MGKTTVARIHIDLDKAIQQMRLNAMRNTGRIISYPEASRQLIDSSVNDKTPLPIAFKRIAKWEAGK